jgi:broad specificity phosphatase PhoE
MPISVSLFASRFLFVRHGESVSNAAELFSGQMDMELTEQGKRDAEESVRWLAEEEIGSIYSSPLKRVW